MGPQRWLIFTRFCGELSSEPLGGGAGSSLLLPALLGTLLGSGEGTVPDSSSSNAPRPRGFVFFYPLSLSPKLFAEPSVPRPAAFVEVPPLYGHCLYKAGAPEMEYGCPWGCPSHLALRRVPSSEAQTHIFAITYYFPVCMHRPDQPPQNTQPRLLQQQETGFKSRSTDATKKALPCLSVLQKV